MNIDELLNDAFRPENGLVDRKAKEYEGYVNAMGKPLEISVVAQEYCRIILKMQMNEKNQSHDYYKSYSEIRLNNWMQANYKK